MYRRKILVLLTWGNGFSGFDYEMQARRTYLHEHVHEGGYVIPRPPDPVGTQLPTDAELRPQARQPEMVYAPQRPEPPPP
eukprot:4278138-Alexandrium_andersonii.AAC.1